MRSIIMPLLRGAIGPIMIASVALIFVNFGFAYLVYVGATFDSVVPRIFLTG